MKALPKVWKVKFLDIDKSIRGNCSHITNVHKVMSTFNVVNVEPCIEAI